MISNMRNDSLMEDEGFRLHIELKHVKQFVKIDVIPHIIL